MTERATTVTQNDVYRAAFSLRGTALWICTANFLVLLLSTLSIVILSVVATTWHSPNGLFVYNGHPKGKNVNVIVNARFAGITIHEFRHLAPSPDSVGRTTEMNQYLGKTITYTSGEWPSTQDPSVISMTNQQLRIDFVLILAGPTFAAGLLLLIPGVRRRVAVLVEWMFDQVTRFKKRDPQGFPVDLMRHK